MYDLDIDAQIYRRLGFGRPAARIPVPTAAEQVIIDDVLAEVDAEWPATSELLGLSPDDEASVVLANDYDAIAELATASDQQFALRAAREQARRAQDTARRMSGRPYLPHIPPHQRAESALADAMSRIGEQTYVPAGGVAEFAARTMDGYMCGPADEVTSACSSRYHSPACHMTAELDMVTSREDAETWNRSLRNRAVAGDLGDQLGLRTRPAGMVSFMTSSGEQARP